MYDVCGQLRKTAKSKATTMVINDNSLESPGPAQESSPHTCNPRNSKFMVHGAPYTPSQFRAEKSQREEPFVRLPKPGRNALPRICTCLVLAGAPSHQLGFQRRWPVMLCFASSQEIATATEQRETVFVKARSGRDRPVLQPCNGVGDKCH